MQRLLSVSLLFATTSCTYDQPVGRTVPPPAPGHFELRWATKLGGLALEQPTAVASASDGDWYVAGTTYGTAADLDASPAPQPPPSPSPVTGSARGFVAKLSGSDGAPSWVALVDDFAVVSVRLAPAGDDVIACGHGRASDGTERSFVRKYDATGQLVWSHAFGAGSYPVVLACAARPNGTVVIGGGYTGTIDVGDGPVAAAEARPAEHPFRAADAFLLQLDADGDVIGGRTFPAPGQQAIYDLLVETDGEITALAYAWGSVSFGGATFTGTLDHADPSGQVRVFLRFSEDAQHLASTELPAITHATRSHVTLARANLDRFVVVHDEVAGPQAGAQLTRFELDATGTILDTSTRGQRASSAGEVAANGMTVAVASGPGAFDLGGSMLSGDSYLVAYDVDLSPLGAIALSGDAASVGELSPDFRLTHAAMFGSSVAVVGRFDGSFSFGGTPVWAHGAGLLGTDGYQLGAPDVVVAVLDWVEDGREW